MPLVRVWVCLLMRGWGKKKQEDDVVWWGRRMQAKAWKEDLCVCVFVCVCIPTVRHTVCV